MDTMQIFIGAEEKRDPFYSSLLSSEGWMQHQLPQWAAAQGKAIMKKYAPAVEEKQDV